MVEKQKILIVDDDENIAELISLYLTKECFETHIVHDGESALKAFADFSPNLILLDLMLPGMDGYQVCREIRKENNTPIMKRWKQLRRQFAVTEWVSVPSAVRYRLFLLVLPVLARRSL